MYLYNHGHQRYLWLTTQCSAFQLVFTRLLAAFTNARYMYILDRFVQGLSPDGLYETST